jgi:hypothetical protein
MHGNNSNVDRTAITIVALALVALLSAPERAIAAACDATGADAAQVADARAAIAGACDCDAAADPRAWRTCVRGTLAPFIGTTLSRACARLVERVEVRSTCGRPDQVVCCATTAAGKTRALLKRSGQCPTPRGGSSCTSPSDFLADACVPGGCVAAPTCGNLVVDAGEDCDPPNGLSCSASCQSCTTELGCVAPSSCGNGTTEVGEACDPPNGTTCSNTCTSCAAAAPGELLIGCTGAFSGVDASALPGTLLVAYTDQTPGGGSHTVARRLANDGTPVDATPLLVSGPLESGALGGQVEETTADSNQFYVSWSTSLDYTFLWGARRIPASGPITADADTILSSFSFGYCRTVAGGPVNLAPHLDDSGFRITWRIAYACGADILAETLGGVGNFFSFPPPGNLSSGPAPIVRGASDVAAVWWNGFVSSVSPPVVDQSLAASFVEPGTPTMIALTPGHSNVAPALAAVGDMFVALFTTGTELRAVRFTRASGALDPPGGLLVTTAPGTIRQIVAAGDGTNVIAAWLESDGTIRAIRIAPDGTLPSPTPITIATGAIALDVAANPTAALVTFSRDEGASRSVRGKLLPPS